MLPSTNMKDGFAPFPVERLKDLASEEIT